MTDPSETEPPARYRPRPLAGAVAALAPEAPDQQGEGRRNRMDAMQYQTMAAGQEARRTVRRTAIKFAQRRREGAAFGWRSDCGDVIGTAPLDRDPALMRCIDCAR
ncbi:TraR/DksA family transcriptional regulator [Rhodobacteraceae bacterium 2376]|uniref:TraR/DksA family transcriptional regulator n=1 Tax=Rhabdonatronobacter sediminivivens TaxID=2743469 RepID=A0A7Z0I232_9RHOB|nr:TraR/DksA family transcriptional regulator [Rhabdonatronobacter sediminivivens]NYS26129.1 TraR/DksA family transcriptional regulator [Rhabdonatronobacter sediminivivens]